MVKEGSFESGARLQVVGELGLIESGQPADHLVEFADRTSFLLDLGDVVRIDRGNGGAPKMRLTHHTVSVRNGARPASRGGGALSVLAVWGASGTHRQHLWVGVGALPVKSREYV